ncbi:hypothetical protein IDH44_00010 [Paenibacillus sp. IB182496]|uniref:Uncharacterized protein n=1 Tax=Paenibacillus sabuli TaxID=2772509 RepID=A0A927GQA6_9BACL|nr:hypothetical protein [Paenibacillus sabuli]MBD2843557.1 hypothetical protein [Paenibacillus sabuli]
MPEYSQIQTYLKCDQSNIKEILLDFIAALNEIGIYENKIISAFNRLEWDIAEDGALSVTGGEETIELKIHGQQIHIRPFVMGWTLNSIKELQQSWLEVSLLLWTEEITQSSFCNTVREEYRSTIWEFMNVFSRIFNQSGVYFTNEATDGRPWEAIIQAEPSGTWMFDAAIINDVLIYYYKEIDDNNFFSKNNETKLLIARKDTWINEPW